MRKPRQWQVEAMEVINGEALATVAACPGAGKTQLALMWAQDLVLRDWVRLVFVVVPNKHLVQQTCDAAHDVFGLKYQPFRNGQGGFASDVDGIVVTYQQLSSDPHPIRRHSDGQAVIFDEAHHLQERARWSEGAEIAFGETAHKLLTTGTPFRSDNRPIAFAEFHNGQLKVDFSYLFGDAWADPTCPIRGLIVKPVDAEGKYRWRGESEVHLVRGSLLEPNDPEEADFLRTCFEPESDWIRKAFEEAQVALQDSRLTYPDAQGLWVADSIRHADAYLEFLKARGIRARVVHGEVDRPHQKLAEFGQSEDEWVVAVDMISEGVDNPRLTTAIYSTSSRTDTYFDQLIGRVLRKRDLEDPIKAHVFTPDTPTFRDLASRIHEAKSYALMERQEREQQTERSLALMPEALKEIFPAENAELSAADFEHGGLDREALMRELDTLLGDASINRLYAVKKLVSQATQSEPTPIVRTEPIVKKMSGSKRKSLRARRNKLVAKLARAIGWDYSKVNVALNKVFGRENGVKYQGIDERSDEDLLRELQYIEEWLESLEQPLTVPRIAA